MLPSGAIFVCGGRRESNSYGLKEDWLIYPHEEFRWEQLPDMLCGHSNHFIIYYDDHIYVLAGCNEANRFTNKCERFSVKANQWESIASLNETRDSISGTLDRRKHCLYIAGGRIDNGVLSCGFEKYHITKNYWKELSIKLPYCVDMHGLILLPGAGTRLVLFAGLDASQASTNRCCFINLEKNISVEIDPMVTGGGCVVNEPRLYGNYVYTFLF
jgi:hypothetical protein